MNTAVQHKLDSFFQKHPFRRFAKGQILTHAGEEPMGIMYLTTGRVRQYDITDRGDEAVVNIYKPRAFFPMSWALGENSNEYFYEAATPVELYVAPPQEVIVLLKTNQDVLYDLLSRVYSGVEGMQRRMLHLMKGSGRSRVLLELVIAAKRFGEPYKNGALVLNMHESELAAQAGLSRETVSRELVCLQKHHVLTVGRQNIQIRDMQAIEALLAAEE